MYGYDRVHADAEAYSEGVHQVLYREHQGEGRHGAVAQQRHEVGVDYVVERVHEHGYDHRQGHAHKQREDRPVLHKRLIQIITPNEKTTRLRPRGEK